MTEPCSKSCAAASALLAGTGGIAANIALGGHRPDADTMDLQTAISAWPGGIGRCSASNFHKQTVELLTRELARCEATPISDMGRG